MRYFITANLFFKVGSMHNLNWEALRCFISIAQHGSLSGAAEELCFSIATLGRRIDTLEASLGMKLLRRGRDGAKLTPNGAAILKLALSGADHLNQISRAARTMQLSPVISPIRISATEPVVAEILAPQLPSLFKREPEIRIELESSTNVTDLNFGEADIAIRMVKPTAKTLVIRQLPIITLGFYCSQSYLDQCGPDVGALDQQTLLWYDSAYGDIQENIWLKEMGLEQAAVMRSSSTKALLEATKAGIGIAPLPDFLARRQDLVHVAASPLPERAMWIAFHRDTRDNRKMKMVRNWIVEAFELATKPPPCPNPKSST